MNETKQSNGPEIWALVDGISGHDSQVLGIAEAMGIPFTKKKLAYNDKASRPNFLKLDGLNTIERKKSDMISEPWPDIVISCGRKSASVARSIKKRAKKSGKKTFAAHILWPGNSIGEFNLVAAPLHDAIIWPLSKSKKLFRFLGSPNRITKEFLLNEYLIWARTIGELPKPRIAVLIGGDSKKTAFTEAHAKSLTESLVKLCAELKATVLVTTSRRTDQAVSGYMEDELKKRIGRYLHFHDFNKSKANPFYAFLQLADMIIVTGDSISMASESCSTGKPVYIFSPDGNASEKHKDFHDSLYASGFATKFHEQAVAQIIEFGMPEKNKADKPLNSAKDVADEIKRRSKLF